MDQKVYIIFGSGLSTWLKYCLMPKTNKQTNKYLQIKRIVYSLRAVSGLVTHRSVLFVSVSSYVNFFTIACYGIAPLSGVLNGFLSLL